MQNTKRETGLSTTAIIIIIVLVFFVAGAAWSLAPRDEVSEVQEEQEELEDSSNDDVGTSTGEGTDVSEANSEGTNSLVLSGDVLAGSSSPLLDFNEADYRKALDSDKLVMLWFYANWCPTCKYEEANAVKPAFNELTTDQVVGFRVNFNDSNTDDLEKQLARDHGILYQEAKVFIKNGEVVKQAPNPWSKEEYLETINQLI